MAIKKISANLLGSNAVLAANIAAEAISAADIADNSITAAKLSTSTFAIDSLTVNTSDLVVDTANNRVGIGTTSPATELDVAGTITASKLKETSGDLTIDSTSTTNDLILATARRMRFFEGGSEVMRIDTSGNLGIGTTSPSNILHAIDSSGNAYLQIGRATQSQGEVGVRLDGGTSGNDWYMYQKNSSDNLNFYNTADRMTIDSSGNVGIGTSSPASLLSVQGDGLQIRIDGTANTSRGLLFRNTGTAEGQIQTDGNMHLIQEDANRYMRFSTANTERMRITSGGDILVGGTTDRNRKLVVEGTGDLLALYSTNTGAGGAQLDLMHDSSSAADDDAIGIINFSTDDRQYASIRGIAHSHSSGHGHLRFGVRTNTSTYNHNAMTLDENGNLGIGTTSPSAKLDVSMSGSGDIAKFTGTSITDFDIIGAPPELNLENSGGTSGQKRARMTLNSQKLSIQGLSDDDTAVTYHFLTCDLSSGNVAIGATSSFSNGNLDVRSSAANTTEVIGVKNDNSGSYNVMMKFYRQSTAVGRIDWDNTGSSMGFVNLSDARLKTVTGTAKGLSFINRLEPKTYNFKDNNWETEGLIAQEVKAAMEAEEIVVRGIREPETEDDYYGLDYGTFVPNLIQAIKELSAKNDALEARITELEG